MQRKIYNGKAEGFLPEEQFEKLDAAYTTANGHKLNPWLCRMKREQDHHSTEQLAVLSAIGMQWNAESKPSAAPR